jgi:hypothetical protein
MVGEVAGDERVLPARLDVHRNVARRVTGGRLESDLVGHLVVGRYEIGEAGVDHGSHRVLDRQRVARLALGVPVLPFLSTHDVPRVREGGHPLAVDQHRVPADVIEVEVGADHGVDLFAREAGGGEVVEERRVEGQRFHAGDLAVVADARVDDDLAVAGGDAEGVDRQHQVAVVVHEVRTEP